MDIEDQNNSLNSLFTSVQSAYGAFVELQTIKAAQRSRAVQLMAKALQNALDEILEANTFDLETSREMAMPELILEWLKLTPERLQNTIQILEKLGNLSDPIQRVSNAPYQLAPSQTYCQRMPLGVISLIYEAFPELGAMAAGFCLKTGNSLILRGGSETSHSNTVIAAVLQTALEEAGLPKTCLQFLTPDGSNTIRDLVTQDQYINLVIPYGRPSLIQQVTQLATVPVLKSAMGNCYLYWSPSGDLDLARLMIIDSHASQPDPVNAIEKVLINPTQKPSSLVRLFNSLQEKGFALRGSPNLVSEFAEYLHPVHETEWGHPYLDKIVAFQVVENIESAIAWINHYSSGHADCLVTESYEESRLFAMGVDSALVYINASPRFCRNPQSSSSVFLGMSSQKGQRRGLIGLEAFTTIKQVVQGEGKL